MDWKTISCKTCKYKKKCKGVSKGSRKCQEKLGLMEKKIEPSYHPHLLLWALYNVNGGKPNVKTETE